jgi:hypothetical protein
MVDSINVAFNELDGCRVLNDTLHSQIYQHQQGYSNLKHQSKLQSEKMSIMDSIDIEQTRQINIQNEVIRKGTKKNKWLKLQRNVLAVALAITIVKIFVIH